jgi:hypothetical protein
MKRKAFAVTTLGFLLLAGSTIAAEKCVAPAPNGITLPEDYKDWRVISSTSRTDNNTMRIIVGNDTAIEAARAGKTNPWPDGAILGKLIWNKTKNPEWESAEVPGQFVHSEFMVKDSAKFKETGGWGYARWIGMDQKPYGKFNDCYECHQGVKDKDYVFTQPVMLP